MSADKILYLLGKYYDEWANDEDWWFGLHNADINVVKQSLLWAKTGDFRVVVYGVGYVWGDDGEQYIETDTGVVLDEFTFNVFQQGEL